MAGIFPFMWVFLRTVGLTASAPILGSKNISWPSRIGMSMAISSWVYARLATGFIPNSLSDLVLASVCELAVGFSLGFLGQVVVSAADMAGHLMDLEMGLGMANVVDPGKEGTSPLMGAFNNALLLFIFLTLGFHHVFIKALLMTFSLFPAGNIGFSSVFAQAGVKAAGEMFRAGLLLSSPVWAASLVLDMALGMMARTVPQINVFMMGMPLKMLMGLTILSFSFVFYGYFAESMLRNIGSMFDWILGALAI